LGAKPVKSLCIFAYETDIPRPVFEEKEEVAND